MAKKPDHTGILIFPFSMFVAVAGFSAYMVYAAATRGSVGAELDRGGNVLAVAISALVVMIGNALGTVGSTVLAVVLTGIAGYYFARAIGRYRAAVKSSTPSG
jgi:hypothetical protein